jgi:hypothetical protein
MRKGERICPRCGKPFNYLSTTTIGKRTYVYAVHVIKAEGKNHIKKCYLGPREGYYKVEGLHEQKTFDKVMNKKIKKTIRG